jgi:uncharacterized protein YecE (DUF72 family)
MSGSVLWGTSSWTYEGWEGLVYADVARYGKHFKRESLREYARCGRFECVGIDGSHYRPPSIAMLRDYAVQLPRGFPCVVKVWRALTNPFFSSHFGPAEALGEENPDFLSAEVFRSRFLPVFRAYFRDHVGAFVLEIPPLSVNRMGGGEFLDRLDAFLGALDEPWPMSVEIRTREWLSPAYFEVLEAHGAAHAFNVWTGMPLPDAVMDAHPQALQTASFGVCRALVAPGVRYADAVKRYQPYASLQAPNMSVRGSLERLARAAIENDVRMLVSVNNRLEGCAPLTIEAMRARLAGEAARDTGGC